MKKVYCSKKSLVSLTPAQFKILRNYKQRNYVCGGRRCGKSVLLREMIKIKCLTYRGEYNNRFPPVIVLVCPTIKQARAVHWDSLKSMFEGLEQTKKINNTDLKIEMKGKLPDIYVRGLNDNGDSLRGLKIYSAFIDEFQDCPEIALTEVIEPALADTKGSSLLAIGTPKGKASFFYEVFSQAQKRPDKNSTTHLTTYDNPYVSREQISMAQEKLPPRVFRQEFLASFEDFEGQIFISFTQDNIIKASKQLKDIPFRYIGIDWGDLNPAIVVLGGYDCIKENTSLKNTSINERSYNILDYWKNPNPGQAIEPQSFLKTIKYYSDKWKPDAIFCDPSEPGNIMTVRKMTGVNKTVSGYNRVREGNSIMDIMFHQKRLYVLEELTEVINDLNSYHREVKNGIVMEKPADKQPAEHICDSIRYVIATMEHKNIGRYMMSKFSEFDPYKRDNP